MMMRTAAVLRSIGGRNRRSTTTTTIGQRIAGTTSTTRSSSSRRSSSSTTTATSPPSLSLSQLQSRRVVNLRKRNKKQQQEGGSTSSNNNKTSKSSTTKSTADEKPWPKNVVYGAYVAAAVVIPYTALWISLNYIEIRDKVWVSRDNVAQPNIPDYFRKHFGEIDYHTIPYTVPIDENETDVKIIDNPILYRLPDELSIEEQNAEIELQDVLNNKIRVKLMPVDNNDNMGSTTTDVGTNNTTRVTVELPASLTANLKNLIEQYTTLAAAVSAASSSPISSIGVAFPDDTTQVNDAGDETLTSSSSNDMESSMTTVSFEGSGGDGSGGGGGIGSGGDDEKAEKKMNSDPLVSRIHTYSTWYHQGPIQQQQQQNQGSGSNTNHVTSTITDEEIQIKNLEHLIDNLEKELRDINTTRPYDDVQDDLNRAKANLRQLRGGGIWRSRSWKPW